MYSYFPEQRNSPDKTSIFATNFAKESFTQDEESRIVQLLPVLGIDFVDSQTVSSDLLLNPFYGKGLDDGHATLIDELDYVMANASLSTVVEFNSKFSESFPSALPILLQSYVRSKCRDFATLYFGSFVENDSVKADEMRVDLLNFMDALSQDYYFYAELFDGINPLDVNYITAPTIKTYLFSLAKVAQADSHTMMFLEAGYIPGSKLRDVWGTALSKLEVEDLATIAQFEELINRSNFEITTLDLFLMRTMKPGKQPNTVVYDEMSWAMYMAIYLKSYFEMLTVTGQANFETVNSRATVKLRKESFYATNDLFKRLQMRAETHPDFRKQFEVLKTIYKYEEKVEVGSGDTGYYKQVAGQGVNSNLEQLWIQK